MLSVNWDVSPVIFNIGSFQLRYYGVLFIIGFYLGYYMFRHFFRRENKPLELLDTLLWTLMICTIVGARLGHVLFYQPDYYLANPLEILKVWHGGLASHGGTIAIMIGMWWFVKKYGRKHNFGYIWLLDRLAVATAFAAGAKISLSFAIICFTSENKIRVAARQLRKNIPKDDKTEKYGVFLLCPLA
jgi:prolipoprotein diacylglyceryl transferase